MFIIKDWADNTCFNARTFDSFEDAWGYLYETVDDETAYDDYFVVPVEAQCTCLEHGLINERRHAKLRESVSHARMCPYGRGNK